MGLLPPDGRVRRTRFSSFVALVALLTGSCVMGRDSSGYRSFIASHDAIRPGMSIRQVFEAGLADYLIKAGSKNVPGSTVPDKQPVSADCRRHVFDVHYGGGDPMRKAPGGFSVRVYCDMNGPSDRQVAPQGAFQTAREFLDGLEAFSVWTKNMSFRVESPPLEIGGVYDSYSFTTDQAGLVATVSPINH